MSNVETEKVCPSCAEFENNGKIILDKQARCKQCGKSYVNHPALAEDFKAAREDDAYRTLDNLECLLGGLRYAIGCSNPMLLPILLDQLTDLSNHLHTLYNLPSEGRESIFPS